MHCFFSCLHSSPCAMGHYLYSPFLHLSPPLASQVPSHWLCSCSPSSSFSLGVSSSFWFSLPPRVRTLHCLVLGCNVLFVFLLFTSPWRTHWFCDFKYHLWSNVLSRHFSVFSPCEAESWMNHFKSTVTLKSWLSSKFLTSLPDLAKMP